MANEMRLIDANTLKAEFTGNFHEMWHYTGSRAMIDVAPTVDAKPVVHGRWVSDEGDVLFHCSECETQISTSWNYDDLHWNYCPNCGAQMYGGNEDG